MKASALLQIAAGLGVAAAGVWIFKRQVHPAEMLEQIRLMPLWKIALVVLLNPATLLLRSWRWKIMLPDRSGCSKRELFPLVTIGFMANNFFPARIGEAVRAALLWKRNRFTVAESVGSLLVERFLDVLVFLVFLFLPVFILPQLHQLFRYALLLAALFSGVITVFALYGARPQLVRSTVKLIVGKLPAGFQNRLVPVGRDLLSNLNWLFSVRKATAVAVLSFLTMFCQIGMLQTLGFGVERFGFFTSMFGIAFAAIGAAIPLAPGYVGTLHAMMLQGLGMAGIASDIAGAIVVVYHATGYVTIACMGLFYFFSLKLSIGDIRGAKKRIAD